MTVGHGQQQPQPYMMSPVTPFQMNQYPQNLTPLQQQAMLGMYRNPRRQPLKL